MIILKIGGSILTEKDSAEPKVDYENLNRIAEEIRESLYAEEISNDLIDGIVIVHGAGSFGHPPAKKYQIGQPFEMKDYLEKRIGFAEVQNAESSAETATSGASDKFSTAKKLQDEFRKTSLFESKIAFASSKYLNLPTMPKYFSKKIGSQLNISTVNPPNS